MITDEQVASLLRDAVTVLDERGWHQGWFVDDDNRCVCVFGAVALAAGLQIVPIADSDYGDGVLADHDSEPYVLYTRAAEHLNEALDGDAAEWNDTDGRTVDEVKDALVTTAERLSNPGLVTA